MAESRRSIRRPRRGCENNIKVDIENIYWDGFDGINVVWDRDNLRAVVREEKKFVVYKM